MDNSIKELGKIRDAIITGGISESQLREMMDKMKKEYGEDVFKPYDLNSIQQYVYTKAYYGKLVKLAKNGACSQEFYLHLVNVRDSVKKQKIMKIGLFITGLIIIGLVIVNLCISLNNSKMLKKVINDKNKTDAVVSVKEEAKVIVSDDSELKIEKNEVSTGFKNQKWEILDSDEINTKFVKRALNGEDVKTEYDSNSDTSKSGVLKAIQALGLNTEQIKIVGRNIKNDEKSFFGE